MKIKKLWNCILMLLLTFSSVMFVVSCGDDNDQESQVTLTGTWRMNDRILEIGSGNSWHTYFDNTSYGPQHRYGTYSYDKTTQTIIVSIREVSGNNGAYTQTYFVQSLTSSTLALVLLYDDGTTQSFLYQREN